MKAINDRLQDTFAHFRQHWRPILVVVASIILLSLIGLAAYFRWGKGWVWADWTGLGPYMDADGKLQRGKTLWDWLELLIIPAVLALGGLLFNKAEKANELKILQERNKQEQKIATDSQRYGALQAYIDRMNELLLDKKTPLRKSKGDDEVRTVARTRTLATCSILDAKRKGILLRFLFEAGLISKGHLIISLSGADFSDAELIEANLIEADLSHVNMMGADLRGAKLHGVIISQAYLDYSKQDGVDLSEADLSGTFLNEADLLQGNLYLANLEMAHMSGTKLIRANLQKAILRKSFLVMANMSKANLIEADLSEATMIGADLSEANLTGANLMEADLPGAILDKAIVTNEQLATVKSLEGATMPDGIKYDPAIHTFAEKKAA